MSTKGTCPLRVSVGTMREGAKDATLRASRKSVTQFPFPAVSFISR